MAVLVCRKARGLSRLLSTQHPPEPETGPAWTDSSAGKTAKRNIVLVSRHLTSHLTKTHSASSTHYVREFIKVKKVWNEWKFPVHGERRESKLVSSSIPHKNQKWSFMNEKEILKIGHYFHSFYIFSTLMASLNQEHHFTLISSVSFYDEKVFPVIVMRWWWCWAPETSTCHPRWPMSIKHLLELSFYIYASWISSNKET